MFRWLWMDVFLQWFVDGALCAWWWCILCNKFYKILTCSFQYRFEDLQILLCSFLGADVHAVCINLLDHRLNGAPRRQTRQFWYKSIYSIQVFWRNDNRMFRVNLWVQINVSMLTANLPSYSKWEFDPHSPLLIKYSSWFLYWLMKLPQVNL